MHFNMWIKYPRSPPPKKKKLLLPHLFEKRTYSIMFPLSFHLKERVNMMLLSCSSCEQSWDFPFHYWLQLFGLLVKVHFPLSVFPLFFPPFLKYFSLKRFCFRAVYVVELTYAMQCPQQTSFLGPLKKQPHGNKNFIVYALFSAT